MRILISTIGSSGDVLPFVPLAEKLVQRGHQVRVCTHDVFASAFAATGAEFFACGPHVIWERIHRVQDRIATVTDGCEQVRIITQAMIDRGGVAFFEDVRRLARGCDLAVCQQFDFAGQEAAIAEGLPWAMVSFVPGMLRLPGTPPMDAPDLGPANAALWALASFQARRVDAAVQRFLSEVGTTRRIRLFGRIELNGAPTNPSLILLAASPVICGLSDRLGAGIHATGAWLAKPPATFTPPFELREFLASGDKPIVITFGSVRGGQPRQTGELISAAVRLAGVRAVVQRGWGGVEMDPNPNVLLTDVVPHGWLFPRVRGVVHHGGAGVMHAAAHAGVAQLAIPHMTDQPYWGKLIARHGLGPQPVSRRQLTPAKLAAALRTLVESSSLALNACELATRLAAEPGASAGVTHIEQWAEHAFGQQAGLLAQRTGASLHSPLRAGAA